MAQLNFDARNVEPNQTFDPVPAGWYVAQIVRSETKPTSKQDGSYLELELEILHSSEHGNKYNGRKLFDRLNLNNKNQVAVDIAYQTLSAICHATNVITVQDSQQLHNIPLEVKAKVRPATAEYEAQNEVKGYRAIQNGGGQGGGGNPNQNPNPNPNPAPVNTGWNGGQPQNQNAQWGGQPQNNAPTTNPQQNPAATTNPAGNGGGGQPWGGGNPNANPNPNPQQDPNHQPQNTQWGGQPQNNAGGQPAGFHNDGSNPTGGANPSANANPNAAPWNQNS